MSQQRLGSGGGNSEEREPLLRQGSSQHLSDQAQGHGSQHHSTSYGLAGSDNDTEDGKHVLRFGDDDPDHPRNWPRRRKLANVVVIASMAIMSPLASASFTPAMSDIGADLGVDSSAVIAATTGFVISLGVGPLVLAPLSETFGRRVVYLVCFSIFTLLQIPTALSPNIETLVILRTLAGFVGAVGIANGGGTISDMFPPEERAGVFGVYLLGPVMGPALGPVLGGVVVQFLTWRWIFWVMAIMCLVINISAFLFLRESYAPALLAQRKRALEKDPSSRSGAYTYEGEDSRPLWRKVTGNLWRPLIILFTQPIVMVMASYQSILWACQYSLLTQFEQIWSSEPYNFQQYQVGLMYLPMGVGFFVAATLVIPRIDDVYRLLTKRNDGVPKPEFRLPLANIGAVFVPICLFIFAWSVEYKLHWAIIFVMFPFGVGQTAIFNCTQNYYIDAFEKYAASAIAAGSLFRSLVGGIVPIFMPGLVESAGYGWAISLFGFASAALAPAPLLFFRYGPFLREKFKIEL